MIVAFDFHGSVDVQPNLRALAQALLGAGNDCHVISAIGHESHKDTINWRLEQIGIPWSGVHFVIFPRPLTVGGAVEWELGNMKADIMAKIGATILFDDNPYICKAVRARGYSCFFVGAL